MTTKAKNVLQSQYSMDAAEAWVELKKIQHLYQDDSESEGGESDSEMDEEIPKKENSVLVSSEFGVFAKDFNEEEDTLTRLLHFSPHLAD